MNKLIDYVRFEEDYQNAINIEYDLHDIKKIVNYIPTSFAVDLIEDIMLSIDDNSNDRARLIIGAYGKGKSHLVLVILSLLNEKNNSDVFLPILKRIKKVNKPLYYYILRYLDDDKRKLLPVIIPGTTASLSQSFLIAIQKALSREKLSQLMPDTHFDAAIKMLKNWEINYPSTLKQFEKATNQKMGAFLVRLKSFNSKAYSEFIKVYPSLTSGGVFNPFFEQNTIELYNNINKKLPQYGYNGMYIIYDEFSKYLEADIKRIPASDIRLLQDFAENCNRSKANQMHLLLIAHKDITNYIDELPAQKMDGWRGVSERFKHIELQNNYIQSYELISKIIDNNKLYKRNHQLLNNVLNENFITYKQNHLYDELESEELSNLFLNCYPLHPATIFLLPRISEKVAQNERTYITYLSSKNRNTFWSFVKDENIGSFITPDYIYDYFESLFKNEVYNGPIYCIWKKAFNILESIENNDLEKKIIKTLALVHIAEQFDKLAPTFTSLCDIYKCVYSLEDINDAISDLRDKKFVIYQFKTNHHLRLKNSNGIDINQSIKDKEQICKNKYSFIEILQKYNFEHYLYPTRYNDDQEVIRYFQVIFISDDIFLQVKNWNKKIENIDADGVIYNIVCKDKSNFEIIRKKLDGMLDFPRIIFVISEEKNSIEESVYIYQTAKSMLDDEIIQADPLMIQELNTVIEDNSNVLGRFITNYSVPEKRKSEYYHNGRRINICRKMQLSDLMSKICIEMYPNYPIVTNELINKTELSTSVINARDKIINALLSKKLEDRLGLEGYGPDVTIMRSTLVNTNIIKNIDNEPYISEHISEKWDYCFKVIEDFFLHSNKSSFSVLYKKLMKPSGGIGIKKGVIPIYIAVVIRKIREFTVFYHHDEEIDLSVNLLDRINISPNEYAVSLENWNAEKEQYIKAMERLFYKYMDEYEQNINPFSEIVLAVQRWYISLPKYTKEMKKHYQGNGNYLQNDLINVKFTNALKRNNINSREFLFDFLPNLFKKNNDYDAITKKVLIIKNEYDNELNNLFEKLKSDIMIHFQKIAHPDWSLSSVLREWYENLKKETKSHLFNHGENRVMTLIKNASNDEKSLIEQLAKHFTGLRVEDWNDNTIKIFNDSIKQFIETVTREDNTKQSNDRCEGNDKVFMGYYAENGQRVEHSFQRVNYSKRAELLKNEVEQAVEDMGSSISDNEKRQVIMDILEQLCR